MRASWKMVQENKTGCARFDRERRERGGGIYTKTEESLGKGQYWARFDDAARSGTMSPTQEEASPSCKAITKALDIGN